MKRKGKLCDGMGTEWLNYASGGGDAGWDSEGMYGGSQCKWIQFEILEEARKKLMC